MSIYLDYNASAPINEEVLKKMNDVYLNTIGNPDSRTHGYGDSARFVVEEARKQVASLLSVDPVEVFFTSGATESNNIAIQGLYDYSNITGKNHIVSTAIEHKAVLETVKHMSSQGFDVDTVSPDQSGRISDSKVLSCVKDNTLLVSVMHVNNETGIIQPVDVIGNALQNRDVLFHIDATQSCGKLVEEIKELKYDMLSFSSHKMGGPQGVGVLIIKRKNGKRLPIKPIMFGGQQESGIRPGTVPVALVAGCGEACNQAMKNYKKNNEHSRAVKSMIIRELNSSGLDFILIGDQNHCLSSTLSVSIKGISSEALMLSTKQYCSISNGSACTSKSYTPSYVLSAMGLDESIINGAIRISWGERTVLEAAQESIKELLKVAYNMIN